MDGEVLDGPGAGGRFDSLVPVVEVFDDGGVGV
jgi:hypothetical protein